MNFKVTFHLDGSGVFYDPFEPPHLDALLAYCLAGLHAKRHYIGRDDQPEEVPLPLLQGERCGVEVWRASALFPEGEGVESIQYWRKKFRQNRMHLTKGSPNLTNATYREWNTALPMLCVPRMVCWASGSRKEVVKLLRRDIKYLGKKRAHGHGRIVRIEAEECDEDLSWVRDGKANRFLPDEGGGKLVRPKPPYWNNHGRVRCMDIGCSIPAVRADE